MQLFTAVGNGTCFLFRFHHIKGITCLWSAIKAEDQCRFSRTGLLNTLVTLVEHRLHTTKVGTGNHDVSLMQGTVFYQYRRYVTAALVEFRLNDGARCPPIGVGFQFQKVCLKQYLLEQFLNTNAFLCGNILRLIFTAPVFHQVVHLGKPFLDLFGISSGFINFVDCKHDGHTCRTGMVDCFHRLWHHIVIGSHDNNGYVRHFGSTGTHGRKCLVAWCVEEGDLSAVVQLHVVSSYVLGDSPGFTSNHVRAADTVE